MVNTGIFFLAHQASSNVNESLSQATSLIADAIATRGQGEATLRGAQPPQFGPDVTHQVESLQPVLDDAAEKETWIDPRDYKNPHEFAVGNAKKMMEEGRFEEARRLLYWVLANQQRAPLTPSMRAEIDYLIPLTYYQQGRATGLEQEGARDGRSHDQRRAPRQRPHGPRPRSSGGDGAARFDLTPRTSTARVEGLPGAETLTIAANEAEFDAVITQIGRASQREVKGSTC